MPSDTASKVRRVLFKRLVEMGKTIEEQRVELDAISGALLALAPDDDSREKLQAALDINVNGIAEDAGSYGLHVGADPGIEVGGTTHKPLAEVAGRMLMRRKGIPRGRARQCVMIIERHPDGIKGGEIAKVLDMKPNYLYRVLGQLLADGQITKEGQRYLPA